MNSKTQVFAPFLMRTKKMMETSHDLIIFPPRDIRLRDHGDAATGGGIRRWGMDYADSSWRC